MKLLLSLLVAVVLASNVMAAAGPLRVLYLGKPGTASARHCALLMQELGRDAIWFDYTADPAAVTREMLSRFDAVVLDAPAGQFGALGAPDAERLIKPEFPQDPTATPSADFMKRVREDIVAAAGAARRTEWERFLAQREPEKREPNPFVANYEKRPEPITFQHPLSVKGSMERTQVPVDMRLELFASEPEIMKPIAFAWDERGRLWVAETRDYPHGISSTGEGHDDLRICEDTDGDGRADKFTVFAEKLNLPTSLTFSRGGVIVSQPPSFLFLKDTDGDDKADVREVLMEGWGVNDTHAQANSLHYGIDNWIYGCVGYAGFKGSVGGKLHDFRMGTFRFRPEGSALEFLHQFSNNAWAHSMNAAGDQFGGTANNAPLFFGGIPAAAVPAGARVMTAKKINVEDKAHAITPNYRQVDVFGGYTAAAGSAFIYSKNLPPRLQGQALVCEPTMKLISLMEVRPEGAGYVAEDAFNLVASSDEWMSPVFAEVGPDGAVWFADFQNYIIQHNPTPSVGRGGFDARTGAGGAHENPLRDHERGRIYRVAWEKAAKAKRMALKGASAAELATQLGSDVQAVRLTAQRLLVDNRMSDAAPELKKLVAAPDASIAAVHALWTLRGLGQLDEAMTKAALAAKDPALRRNAIRALGSDGKSQELFFAAGSIADVDPATRLAALVKLSEFPTTPEIQTLVRGLAGDARIQGDEWLREAAKLLVKKHQATLYREGPNLLPNPGFETTGAAGLPEHWQRRDLTAQPGSAGAEWKVVTAGGMKHSGERAVRCITRTPGDSSLVAEVPVKPNTRYRLSAFVKTHALRGAVSLKEQVGKHETERVTARESDWTEIETVFNSGDKTRAEIALLHSGQGDGVFDDVKLCEITGDVGLEEKLVTGEPRRGEQIFYKHPATACVLCHSLKGQGSTVGPALDGIASRQTPTYIQESLVEPNKVLAKGFEHIGASPMPPLNLILKPQEIEDLKAFLQTLK
jgi:putative membrane-bound dehydrogenase-like protein